jgi:FkbM family methyltransferase
LTAGARLGRDLRGLISVCGLSIALRWALKVLLRLPDVVRQGNLQPADAAMGEGPFAVHVKRYGCRFQISGPCALAGIRELYVRDVYLRNRWLQVGPGGIVVDLGANMGNFSALALACHPTVRVVAVEPSRQMISRFIASVGLNPGFLDRVLLLRAFVGSPARLQRELLAAEPEYADAGWLTEDDLIDRGRLTRISLLKCDIEGSEFGLLGPDSRLLALADALACEVHAPAGDVPAFVSGIATSGFSIGPVLGASDGSVTIVAKRPTAAT